jgi:hypothetical protein
MEEKHCRLSVSRLSLGSHHMDWLNIIQHEPTMSNSESGKAPNSILEDADPHRGSGGPNILNGAPHFVNYSLHT